MSAPSFLCAGQEPLRRCPELPAATLGAEVKRAPLMDDGHGPAHLHPHTTLGIADQVPDIAYAPVLQPQPPVRHLPDPLVVTDRYNGAARPGSLGRRAEER